MADVGRSTLLVEPSLISKLRCCFGNIAIRPTSFVLYPFRWRFVYRDLRNNRLWAI